MDKSKGGAISIIPIGGGDYSMEIGVLREMAGVRLKMADEQPLQTMIKKKKM